MSAIANMTYPYGQGRRHKFLRIITLHRLEDVLRNSVSAKLASGLEISAVV